MKKTLIIIMLFIMSAGAFASADVVLASEVNSTSSIPTGQEITRLNRNSMEFYVSMGNLSEAIIEYSYYANNILVSELEHVNLSMVTGNSTESSYNYVFSLPEDALSVIIWRVITNEDKIKSLNGTFEYTNSSENAISEVDARIKKIFIEDDFIAREYVPISYGGTLSSAARFKMYFDLVDEFGNTIPIDYITSLEVEYDLITYIGFGAITVSNNHYVKTIEATVTRSATYWPFIVPETVINNIDEAPVSSEYDWYVTLGEYQDADGIVEFHDVVLDQTTMISISYFYQGVFYEREAVQDEPYDADDIVDVIPGTTEELTWLNLIEGFLENTDSTIRIILYAIVLIATILLLVLLKNVLGGVFWIIKAIWNIIVFIVWKVPKGILAVLKGLFIPSNKRRERKKNANRYI